jgi:hypothetical protein
VGSRLVISKRCGIGGVGMGKANVISHSANLTKDLAYLGEACNNISEGLVVSAC